VIDMHGVGMADLAGKISSSIACLV
jgi:hypothetical protein